MRMLCRSPVYLSSRQRLIAPTGPHSPTKPLRIQAFTADCKLPGSHAAPACELRHKTILGGAGLIRTIAQRIRADHDRALRGGPARRVAFCQSRRQRIIGASKIGAELVRPPAANPLIHAQSSTARQERAIEHLSGTCPAISHRGGRIDHSHTGYRALDLIAIGKASRRSAARRACNRAPPSPGPGEPGCKLAPLQRGAAAALPEGLRQRRCQGEKLLAVMFEQQEPRVRDLQPFPQRGGTGGRQIRAIGAHARLRRHGAFLRG